MRILSRKDRQGSNTEHRILYAGYITFKAGNRSKLAHSHFNGLKYCIGKAFPPFVRKMSGQFFKLFISQTYGHSIASSINIYY